MIISKSNYRFQLCPSPFPFTTTEICNKQFPSCIFALSIDSQTIEHNKSQISPIGCGKKSIFCLSVAGKNRQLYKKIAEIEDFVNQRLKKNMNILNRGLKKSRNSSSYRELEHHYLVLTQRFAYLHNQHELMQILLRRSFHFVLHSVVLIMQCSAYKNFDLQLFNTF